MSITREELRSIVISRTANFQNRFDSDTRFSKSKRYGILKSEIKETKLAKKLNDLVEIIDGLLDQAYVNGGSYNKATTKKLQEEYLIALDKNLDEAIELIGIEAVKECFIEIDDSNMSKTHLSFFHVQETFDRYHLDVKDWRIKQISETEILVYDNSINKLLKPSNYKKANLKPILEKYGYL